MSIFDRDEHYGATAQAAIAAQKNACAERTKVGAALYIGDYPLPFLSITQGCNVEATWKSGSVHAEVNAITSMVTDFGPDFRFDLLVLCADRAVVTPCGACRDWLMQFGKPEAEVIAINSDGTIIGEWSVAELIPHYPNFQK